MRRVYRFILIMTLCWVLVLPVWVWISPYYGKLLAVTGNVVFHKNPLNDYEISYRFEKISIIAHLYFNVTRISDGSKVLFQGSPSWDSRRFHFGFTIWTALLLATPFDRRWGKKATCFFVGWAVIFVTQLFGLFFQTLHHNLLFLESLAAQKQYLSPTGYDYFLGWIGRYMVLIGTATLPIIVWLFIGVPKLRNSMSCDRLIERPENRNTDQHSAANQTSCRD